ncbi:hypothetical protein BKA61DRAFT_674126 [Leptodontidium sp. MPI-SDFR-AT-0119]|nr:hypothetical protein BKA61DRAFT_674126 [Leptodontidium sp. MPI-SDFR-AT-0119]
MWGPVVCTPLTWKPEMLMTPIFRRADGVVTSPTLALTYSQFRDCLNRLGLAAGFLEKLTSYCFRRGTANVVDLYNGAYINERVPFDVLSAILERPSADSILRMLTYMSLMRDPRALVHVPDVLAALPPDPSIVGLEEQRALLKAGAYPLNCQKHFWHLFLGGVAITTGPVRRVNKNINKYVSPPNFLPKHSTFNAIIMPEDATKDPTDAGTLRPLVKPLQR